MKLDINKVDLTDNNQKALAYLFVLITVGILWWALPSIVFFLTNLWLAIALAVPLVLIVINRGLIWNIYKYYAWELTKKWIGSNKLGYMWRYYDYIIGQIEKLNKNISSIGSIKVQLENSIKKLQKDIETDSKLAIQAEQQGKSNIVIRTIANRIAINTEQLATLNPRLEVVNNQRAALISLSDNWTANSEDLKFTLEAKQQEYEMLFQVNEATKNAAEFLQGNTEQRKLYNESLKQIEVEVSTFTSNIADFERRAKPVIENMGIARSANEDAGLALIEEYKKKLSL